MTYAHPDSMSKLCCKFQCFAFSSPGGVAKALTRLSYAVQKVLVVKRDITTV